MNGNGEEHHAKARRENQEQDAAERAADYAKDYRDGGRDR